LLPRFRGASPIQAAILAGDTETGVTIIQLVERMDAGPILTQVSTPIEPEEDALSLEQRLAELGADLLVDSMERLVTGQITAEPQDERKATYCQRLDRADALLDWSEPAHQLERKVRAFRGRTDAFTYWNGRLLKVLAAKAEPPEPGMPEPGTVFERLPAQRLRFPRVATADGALLLQEVAIEGRAPTSGAAFLNGYPQFLGAKLSGPGKTG
jgi:methionyl-tRNA formyltransferase